MHEGFCVLEMLENSDGELYDYRYILANDACLQHTAHPKQLGQTARETIPEEIGTWLPRFAEVARSGLPMQFEERLAVTDRWLKLSVHRLEPASQKRVAVVFTGVPAEQVTLDNLQALNHELSNRVDKEQANSRLLGELVDHTLANVFAADRSFRLLAINRTAQETFKRLRGFVPKVGDYIPQFLSRQPDIKSQLEPVWPRVLAGEAFVETIALGGPQALRHYELRYNPLRDAQQQIQGGYLFAYDITERVAEQERLREIENALRQSQKMEAVGQLTGGISHDFNNLLGSILAALEVATQRQAEHRYPEATRLLAIARQDARRAAALVQRLLAFSRQQTLIPQTTDVHQLVAGMHDLINSSLHEGIDFVDQTLAGQWAIAIDPPQLESALLNLCINARDAMPMGGKLCICCANTHLDEAQARVLELPPGDYLQICVSDNGFGMTPDVAQRALEPFFTSKPLGQGSGLGLSIVYGFIRQSGGQLQIISAPGHGTRIDLYLPKDSEAIETAPAPAQPTPDKPRCTPRLIMLVEDQVNMRLVIEEVLQELGHDVRTFVNGRSALDALQAGLRPDLLVTDIGLPGDIDGRQLAAVLPADVAMLYITGYSADQVGVTPSKHCSVLCKPFNLASLDEQIENLLANLHPPQ
ncbi:PAS domain-containing sensor histidine kinase [Pseudomonas putida]|uniref:PAS domain-containing sensor histidine kinase n=1 Tax=Pseudomonas putida TaxID=303 RepID=UPI000B18403C|nr:PAS domain-containing sensor histidine kinase [Pseudomonas putida]